MDGPADQTSTRGELSHQSTPRCPDCGAWQAPIGLNDWTCSNARCSSSWQAARRNFEGSLLGAAIRQVVGDRG